MFFHAYKYKLKSLFREKETFFWIMFFPLILGTFFFMAFSKISSQTENFSTINVAVCADDTDDTAYFKEVIENLYADDRKEVPFFHQLIFSICTHGISMIWSLCNSPLLIF